MIEGLKGFFDNAGKTADLEKRSILFEQTLLDTIEGIEGIGAVYEKGKELYDNESLKRSLSPEEHVQIATELALRKVTWNDLKKIGEMYHELRSIYKEVYKKDAVTAASTQGKMASMPLEPETIGIRQVSNPPLTSTQAITSNTISPTYTRDATSGSITNTAKI